MKGINRWFASVLALFLMVNVAACQTSSDVEWLIEVLNIEKGSVVADVGAGDGNQSVGVARHVGPGGMVYSTELGDDSVEELREEIEDSGLENITVVEGHPEHTNLPEESCDAIYMRRVYHHITDPPSFNRSLYASLKPGGRLAIIEFEPRGPEADPGGRASGNSHGVTADTVIREITDAGFELVSREKRSGRNIYVVFRKPAADRE